MADLLLALCTAGTLSLSPSEVAAAQMPPIVLENEYLRLEISPDARLLAFVDRQSGTDYAPHAPEQPVAWVRVAGQQHQASAAGYADGQLALTFGESGLTARLGVVVKPHYLVLRVASVPGGPADELWFADVQLALKGEAEEPFAACALALNLQTNVPELPRANSRLRAACYPRFGLEGAEVALIGCPPAELRNVMKEVVAEAPALPHSPVGGPWALEGPQNRSSYVFNFGGLSEQAADAWIAQAQSLGFNQIQFHGGSSFRFGDCQLDPATYPNGLASLRAVTDKLHAAGLIAGMQPYAFFIDKRCPWVTPRPDPRLAKDVTFTLAEPLTAEATTVPVTEPTGSMSAITGFFVRNSVTLQLDDELVTYTGVSPAPPYAFTGCQRGACGTQVAPHAAGVKVHHLKECFGLFVPDPETTLLEEVAGKTAELFNEGGFDVIYLDALDGEDVLGGGENAWHYGSRYVFEVWKRLERPAIVEMSTFHHHLWFVRSRLGAWDCSLRAHKRFVDLHVAGNEDSLRMFLPGNLGWWAFWTWGGPDREPTFPDDIEYLCCKAIGTDSGLSQVVYDPASPGHQRLAAIMKRYEALRQAGSVSEAVKAELRAPGSEFALEQTPDGRNRFRRVCYDRHQVQGLDGWSNVWQVRNQFEAQPIALRFEALSGTAPYDAPEAIALTDWADSAAFAVRGGAEGVTVQLDTSTDQVRPGIACGRLTAASARAERRGSWVQVERVFDPPLNLGGHEALGVWVYGDSGGEVLNFQLRSPDHITQGLGEHYVTVDFAGWRYFELVEPDAERYGELVWPYGDAYSIYRESVNFGAVSALSIWVTNLPPNGQATCSLAPVKALPLATTKLANPTITVGDRTLRFPVEVQTGSYLEFTGPGDCRLYGPQGELVTDVVLEGDLPLLAAGDNVVTFRCDAPGATATRARVTVITRGDTVQ